MERRRRGTEDKQMDRTRGGGGGELVSVCQSNSCPSQGCKLWSLHSTFKSFYSTTETYEALNMYFPSQCFSHGELHGCNLRPSIQPNSLYWTVQCSAVQCSVPFIAVQCRAVKCSAVHRAQCREQSSARLILWQRSRHWLYSATLHTASHSTLYTLHSSFSTLYTVYSILYNVHCKLYTILYILSTVQCTVLQRFTVFSVEFPAVFRVCALSAVSSIHDAD